MRRFVWAALSLALMGAGCGTGGPKTYPVSGTVTWNGNPVAEGDILFVSPDEPEVVDAGKIVNGQFVLSVRAGQKRIQIHATREGAFDPAMQTRIREPYIPARYNAQTILQEEVTAEAENRFKFDLR